MNRIPAVFVSCFLFYIVHPTCRPQFYCRSAEGARRFTRSEAPNKLFCPARALSMFVCLDTRQPRTDDRVSISLGARRAMLFMARFHRHHHE
jgi:hypothetical protein